jgi:hypothetical protein
MYPERSAMRADAKASRDARPLPNPLTQSDAMSK